VAEKEKYMEPDFQKKLQHIFNEVSAPKVIELLGHPVHIVDPHNSRSLELLSKAYKDIYEPAFPMEEERESLESWLDTLRGGNPVVKIVIAIVGEKIDTETPVIKGISVGCYYNEEDVGLLAYNAIAPEFRNEGLGRVMVEARKQALLGMAKKNGNPLKGVFIECNDPDKVTPEEDCMDPALRLKIFQKWGAKVMPIDYVQPALTKESEKCEKLKLLAYPHPESGEYPAPDGIKGFVNGIYNELARHNGSTPSEDPDRIRIMAQIDALKQAPPAGPRPPSP